jgi:hypothetical protein
MNEFTLELVATGLVFLCQGSNPACDDNQGAHRLLVLNATERKTICQQEFDQPHQGRLAFDSIFLDHPSPGRGFLQRGTSADGAELAWVDLPFAHSCLTLDVGLDSPSATPEPLLPAPGERERPAAPRLEPIGPGGRAPDRDVKWLLSIEDLGDLPHSPQGHLQLFNAGRRAADSLTSFELRFTGGEVLTRQIATRPDGEPRIWCLKDANGNECREPRAGSRFPMALANQLVLRYENVTEVHFRECGTGNPVWTLAAGTEQEFERDRTLRVALTNLPPKQDGHDLDQRKLSHVTWFQSLVDWESGGCPETIEVPGFESPAVTADGSFCPPGS